MTDLIITGFPRSGTSYLCTLLNKIDAHAIINEPYRLQAQTTFDENFATELADYYQLIRDKSVASYLSPT